MNSKSLQSTAYHEAGHAVVAYWRHYPFRLVTIIPNKTRGSLGHVLFKKLRSFNSIEGDITPTLARRIEDNIVISFAGGIAQRKFHKRGFRRYHTSCDDQSAIDLAFRLDGHKEAAEAYLHWLYIIARFLVDGHWKEIRAGATELIQHMTMSRWDVHRTISLANGFTEAQLRVEGELREKFRSKRKSAPA